MTDWPPCIPDLLALVDDPGERVWQSLRPGVDLLPLYGTGPHGPGAALLRYAAGAEVPAHEHQGYEQILVLAGSQSDHRGSYGPGTLIINPPGTRHAVHSVSGCVVLATWLGGIRVIP